MHTAGHDNSAAAHRERWLPLTMRVRNVVLAPLMASLERESDEGMWYASNAARCFDTNPRLPPQL